MSAIYELIDGFVDFYDKSLSIADKRVASWLFMHSFKTSWIIILVYLVLVYYSIRCMKNRKPFSLNRLLLIYDSSLVLLNAYIVYLVLSVAIPGRYKFLCQRMDHSTQEHAIRLARGIWLFHVSKVIECLDTFLFILRGRFNLVTWLHLYHHCTMIPITWLLTKWAPGGETYNLVVVNSSIHVIMYTYYALAALGPAWRRYLWWKRYLTILQMSQFSYGVLASFASIQLDCGFHNWVYWLMLCYQFSLFCFFYNHYHQTYLAARQKRQLSKSTQKSISGLNENIKNE